MNESTNEKIKTIPPRYIYTYNQYLETSKPFLHQRKKYSLSPSSDFINEIVNSVANGLDIKNIDPQLYSIILNSLESKRDEFLFGANKNLSAAKMTSRAIDKIHRYFLNQEKEQKRLEEIEKAKKNQEQLLESQKRNSKVFTRKDIEKAVSIILEYENDRSNTKLIQQIDPDIHSYLIDELRALKAESLMRNDFKMAEKYENSAKLVILLNSENKYSEIANLHAMELHQKYLIALTDYKKLQLTWQRKIKTMNQEIDIQIKKIQDETDQLLEKFDKQYLTTTSQISTSNSFPIPSQSSDFKIKQTHSNFENQKDDFFLVKFKPSAKLLELRKSEKSLAFSKRYDEAKKLKEYNDRLEQIERSAFASRFNEEIQKRRQEIIKRQKAKIDHADQKGQQKLSFLTRQMNEQIGQAELALKHLEENLKEANKIASLSNIPLSDDKQNLTLENDLKPKRSKSVTNFDDHKCEKVTGAKSEGTLEMNQLKSARFDQVKNQRMRNFTCEKSRRRNGNKQWEQNLFYKRRLINSIVYSKSSKQTDLKRSVRFS